jgi:hypothetical protein
MKALLAIGLASILVFANCKKDAPADLTAGVMTEMPCFSKFGIKVTEMEGRDTLLFVIPDQLKSDFSVEGKKVQFKATLRPNTLVPQFPDPSFDPSTLYQGRIDYIQSAD